MQGSISMPCDESCEGTIGQKTDPQISFMQQEENALFVPPISIIYIIRFSRF
jgi:hypothetical protein